jgi:hypothetical protein
MISFLIKNGYLKTPASKAYVLAVNRVQRVHELRQNWLDLSNLRALRQLPPLDEECQLEELDLSYTGISDLAPIAHLAELQELNLSNTLVSNIASIAYLKKLQKLDLSNTPILNLKVLENLKAIRELDLSGTGVSDLTPLSGLDTLEKLRLSDADPRSDSGGKVGAWTRYLGFGWNLLNIAPLSTLRSLKTLDLTNAPVRDIGAVAKLKALEVLRLSNTEVSDLSPIAGAESLRKLYVERTNITDVVPLANLKNLEDIALSFTGVKDLSPLAENTSLLDAMRSFRSSQGLVYAGCPLSDPVLANLSQEANPRRTLGALNRLRQVKQLPTLPEDEFVKTMPPDLPKQGPGPHFIIRERDGVIDFAAPEAIDREGNNVGRLSALHPILREAAHNLLNGLSPNEHPQLRDIAERYLHLVDRNIDEISFAKLYGEGLRLANAVAAARRQIKERVLPELEDPAREALDTLVALHGPFILATQEGLEIIEAADRYRQSPKEDREFRETVLALAMELQNQSSLINPEAVEFVRKTAEETVDAQDAQRVKSYRVGTGKNLTIVLLGGALIGFVAQGLGSILGPAFAVFALESLKRSKPFGEVVDIGKKALGRIADLREEDLRALKQAGFERYTDFVLKNEDKLRQLAGERAEFHWVHSHLDWLKQHISVFDSN